jgi:NADH-quinone oxidoreductase subunit D
MEEMRQSVRIVQQALSKMPEGPITAKVPKSIRIKDPVEAYHIVESPRGELGYYIIGGNGDTPYKCKIRAPSFCNLQAIAPLCKGHLIADVVTVIGSVDIVLGDVDR